MKDWARRAAYAPSPVDLVPDLIWVLGYLDDPVVVPAGNWLTVRLVPPGPMEIFRAEAAQIASRPNSRAVLLFIVGVWLVLAGLFALRLLRR